MRTGTLTIRLLWFCVWMVSCSGNGADTVKQEVSEPPPNIYLFTVDTLRADHLSVYGYERKTDPWLSKLAKRGVVFENAFATSSWTLPSVASMLTGMHPLQLGVEKAPKKGSLHRSRIPEEAVTVAEWLQEQGYSTFSVTANAHLDKPQGFAQGFDHYQNVLFEPAGTVRKELDKMAQTIDESPGPVFVWIHLFDPHGPYFRREPFLSNTDPSFDAFIKTVPKGEQIQHETITELRKRKIFAKNGIGLPHLKALYDSEILFADKALQRMAKRLQITNDDFVIFTSDHGEEFREHGGLGHHLNLYQETHRIPLIIAGRGITAHRNQEGVSLVQMPATIASLVSPVDDPNLPPLWETNSMFPREPSTSGPILGDLIRLDGGKMQSIYLDGWKLIVNDAYRPRLSLFDLASDPTEQKNQATLEADRSQMLLETLESRFADLPRLEPAFTDDVVDPEVEDQLRAMGYLE